MKIITLNSGATMPMLGLGTWLAADDEIYVAVQQALKVGYRHIDCAPIYMNEKAIGKAIHDFCRDENVQREAIFITSKLWNSFHHPDDVETALRNTLHDLQLDYLDLYLIHWPVAFKASVGIDIPSVGEDYVALTEVPLLDTWQAMEQCQQQGLVKSIGVSNFSISNLQNLIEHASIKPAVNQVECHPYLNQQSLLEYCEQEQIVLTAYSPLGSGGRPAQFMKDDEPALLENPTVLEIANTHQATPAQVLLAWQRQRGIITIPKSTNPERLAANLASLELALTEKEMAALDEFNRDHRYVDGSFWEIENSGYTAAEIWK